MNTVINMDTKTSTKLDDLRAKLPPLAESLRQAEAENNRVEINRIQQEIFRVTLQISQNTPNPNFERRYVN